MTQTIDYQKGYAAGRKKKQKDIADLCELGCSTVDELRQGMREIYEVWAGSESFIPETAPEAYQQKLIEEMRDIASRHIA